MAEKPRRRTIVLCFDGTGNTFRADGSESNILRIFRMLDREEEDQYCYYQPGIGTEVSPTSLASTSMKQKRPWSNKAIELALGQSFDQHLLGGYRFLMRHYRAGAKIYIFGFSRGAYTARFLNDMIDYLGLLSADNEEMIPFIWEAFAVWKLSAQKERLNAFHFLQACRESVCRPIERVQFLGLFDTVSSVSEFPGEGSGFPSTRVIRHAVSIDERRVKFRPVLMKPKLSPRRKAVSQVSHTDSRSVSTPTIILHSEMNKNSNNPQAGPANAEDLVNQNSSFGITESIPSLELRDPTVDNSDVDVQEVWFPGGHEDIGGGWRLEDGDRWALSHGPLVWMVQEAQRAGLKFHPEKLRHFNCAEDSSEGFVDTLHRSSTDGILHDYLRNGPGLRRSSVFSWRLMEYFPFKRMEMRADSSWGATRWPLSRGKQRDIPSDARIHASALRRMQADAEYRPNNLILGGSRHGKGKKVDQGTGEWEVYEDEGDAVRETFVRRGVLA